MTHNVDPAPLFEGFDDIRVDRNAADFFNIPPRVFENNGLVLDRTAFSTL